jgi:DNA primase
MAIIPEETIRQILAATDITELISRSVKLRRAGSNFVGLCPFHNERTPSFSVSRNNGLYHCFGCGASGNAFRFIMDMEGLTFADSAKRLADAAGIVIQEQVWDPESLRQMKYRSLLLEIHKEAARFYHDLLLYDDIADTARNYLLSRGFQEATVRTWQLGYAPASTQWLKEWAQQKKYTERTLIDAGLLVINEESSGPRSSQPYARFRDRLMFPICNESAEIIAFSGRVLDPEAKAAKYLNTAETQIFSKGKIFFGFEKTKKQIAKSSQAILCEGQLDLIRMYESGIQNAVAPLGTAFSEHHAKTLARYADEVVLCYDSDNAGYRAAERSFRTVAPLGLNIRIMALPNGEDPDSLIRQKGPQHFQKLLDRAKEFLDYQVEDVGSQRQLDSLNAKVRFAESMTANIRLLRSPVARAAAIQRVAQKLGIPEDSLKRLVGKGTNSKEPETPDNNEVSALDLNSQDSNSLLLCRMALADAQVLDWLRKNEKQYITQDLIGVDLLQILWSSTYDFTDPHAQATFFFSLPKHLEQAFQKLQFMPSPEISFTTAQSALQALELTRLQNLLQRLQAQLKSPELTQEFEQQVTLEIIHLHQDISKIKSQMQTQAQQKI